MAECRSVSLIRPEGRVAKVFRPAIRMACGRIAVHAQDSSLVLGSPTIRRQEHEGRSSIGWSVQDISEGSDVSRHIAGRRRLSTCLHPHMPIDATQISRHQSNILKLLKRIIHIVFVPEISRMSSYKSQHTTFTHPEHLNKLPDPAFEFLFHLECMCSSHCKLDFPVWRTSEDRRLTGR